MVSKIIERRQINAAVSLDERLEAIEEALALLLLDARQRVQSPKFETAALRMKRAAGRPEEPVVPKGAAGFDGLVQRRVRALQQDGQHIEALLYLKANGG